MSVLPVSIGLRMLRRKRIQPSKNARAPRCLDCLFKYELAADIKSHQLSLFGANSATFTTTYDPGIISITKMLAHTGACNRGSVRPRQSMLNVHTARMSYGIADSPWQK